LAAAVVGFGLFGLSPARAAAGHFTNGSSEVSDGVISVASVDPCPDPTAGGWDTYDVQFALASATGSGGGRPELIKNADGSWSGRLLLDAGIIPGQYSLTAECIGVGHIEPIAYYTYTSNPFTVEWPHSSSGTTFRVDVQATSTGWSLAAWRVDGCPFGSDTVSLTFDTFGGGNQSVDPTGEWRVEENSSWTPGTHTAYAACKVLGTVTTLTYTPVAFTIPA